MKAKINLKNIIAYIQGNIRYSFWYWKMQYNYSWYFIRFIYLIPMHKLINLHIREQIEMRIVSMNKECYDNGSCIKCGCKTTALQMADKPCEGDCYPRMLTKREWNYLKQRRLMVIDKVLWTFKHNKFKKIE